MQQRIQLIDVIRGLCLFGILLSNLLIFQYGMFGKDELDLFSVGTLDWIGYYFLKIFVEGSFMPIFAFLFGYGMVMMRQRSLENNQKPKRKLLRRFLFLMILGFLHATYIWDGDILLTYGMLGIILLVFVARKSKTILVWTIILLMIATATGYGTQDTESVDKQGIEQYISLTTEVKTLGSYTDILEHRQEADPFKIMGIPPEALLVALILMPFVTAPLFLFGMYAAKKEWFKKPDEQMKLYRASLIMIPVAICFKSIYFILPDIHWLGMLSALGANLLAMGYILFIAFIYQKMKYFPLFKGAANVGKLSLTNYLMQSVICTFIFYGYGLGLYGQLGVVYGIILGILVFSVQIVLSHYYLKKWKYGPFEYVLRCVTNWSLMRKNQTDQTYLRKSS
ncbi:DUF418 domain-containing protein [Alkalihalobacillus trypoxylicola]|uniref:DUF418 domain-containing protein n=1 Tax=Alkalihalobacillus trypoxylicola TaxID=519424 RepID=A0A161QKN9_9BACI|nr:DUF418 domain-containing protein [Alkalihalobacillus trypoxylicola]KYG30556.1 hypothetical protein AZF04_19470 [Alkalihalobacillus trypoxylicola]